MSDSGFGSTILANVREILYLDVGMITGMLILLSFAIDLPDIPGGFTRIVILPGTVAVIIFSSSAIFAILGLRNQKVALISAAFSIVGLLMIMVVMSFLFFGIRGVLIG